MQETLLNHPAAFWFVLSGGVLAGVGLFNYFLEDLPITTSLIYLLTGILLGPQVLGVLDFSFSAHTVLIEHVSEIVVVASVFAAGLIVKPKLSSRLWITPLRLAFAGVMISAVCIAFLGIHLGLSWGVALLVGAILAPTDPVLASEVQVEDETDSDHLKFALTAEAGLNDGSAFPFVYLALGIIGVHELGDYGSTWLFHDVIYKFVGAIVVGGFTSYAVVKLLSYIEGRRKTEAILHDFLGLGLLFLIYGFNLYLDMYGFVAAFVAGLIFRRGEDHDRFKKIEEKSATRAIIQFNQQIERFGESICVFWIGVALNFTPNRLWWLAPAVLFLIRPLSVLVSTYGVKWNRKQRDLAAWFGIRGLGSIFYLAFAANQKGFALSQDVISAVLFTIALSIVIHGVSATPLMRDYRRYRIRRKWDGFIPPS